MVKTAIVVMTSILVFSASPSLSRPAGPPEGLDVNVLNAPLAVEVTNAAPVETTIVGPADVNVVNPTLDVNLTQQIEPVQFCGEPFGGVVFTVPGDRRLVIEDGTLSANMDGDGGQIFIAYVLTTVGGVEARHFIGRLAESTFSFERGGRMMKVYADPGTEVRFGFASKASPPGDGPDDEIVCVSGRLEPVEDGF